MYHTVYTDIKNIVIGRINMININKDTFLCHQFICLATFNKATQSAFDFRYKTTIKENIKERRRQYKNLTETQIVK